MTQSDQVVLTIDLERFTQTPAYRSTTDELEKPPGDLHSVDYLLGILQDKGAKATFFVVGDVAHHHPEVVTRIADRGHEIASHSMTHRELSTLTRSDRENEYLRSKEIIENITGQKVEGFRAPIFDVPDDHVENLLQAGYRYDSSILPSRVIPGWYEGSDVPQRPYTKSGKNTLDNGIVELPVSVMPGLRLPISGAWMRFFGQHYTISGIKLLNKLGLSPVLYTHPWEFTELERLSGIPRRVYWRTGKWMRETLEQILSQSVQFVPAKDATHAVE